MGEPNESAQEQPNDGYFTEDYLLFLLAQASDKASRAFHKELQKDGISVPTWRILASLYPNGVLTVGVLAEKCLLKQPTITRVLDRLENSNLVHRIISPKDRRSVLIELTEAGRTLAGEKIILATDHENRLLANYSDQKIADIKQDLKTLAERLDSS
ncbi:MAG: DNA-binding MarR family transcriptional regulator [Paracoccaceae bacterium]|jgi:DNA-binding MarR family transcriptional regulator